MVAPRAAKPTVRFVDEYCASYQDLFADVRSFEAFEAAFSARWRNRRDSAKISAVAKVNGLPNAQSLQQFLVGSPWQVEKLREKRLDLILKLLKGRKLILVIDETGDRKKGRTTDYVKRQYIGNLGKVENGIVSVDAYGVIDNITFPLMFEVYKPKERLKAGDRYQSKPKIAADMIQALCGFGFEFELVLASPASMEKVGATLFHCYTS